MNKFVILVTGTSRGIGFATVQHYLKRGHTVIGCSRSAVDYTHPNYHHQIADVSREEDVKKIFLYIKKNIGSLDVLINNAGRASMNHMLLTTVAKFDDLISTNLKSTFLFSREAARFMMKNKFGRIINFTTVAVPLGLAGEAVYVASKSGVEALTIVMSKEFGTLGITVNAIGPTPINTDLIKGISTGKIDDLVKTQAIRRLGTYEDVINVLDFFIQPGSEFITGQILYLGGVHA